MGKVVEFVPSPACEGSGAANDAPGRERPALAPSTTCSESEARRSPLSKALSRSLSRTLSRTVGDRFFCGAALALLKSAGTAGHHCDEDHVGWYVASSDASGASSIATADAWGR